MSPVRGFHHHFPQYGGMVQHSGPAENCDRPSLGPLTDHRPGRSSDPEPAPDKRIEVPRCRYVCGLSERVHDDARTNHPFMAGAVPALQATGEPTATEEA